VGHGVPAVEDTMAVFAQVAGTTTTSAEVAATDTKHTVAACPVGQGVEGSP